VHSRFLHCLGAAHLARSIARQLIESADAARAGELSAAEPYLVAAALLHDIGHGPFSHAFEPVLARVAHAKVKHEAWTRAIIKGPLKNVLERNGLDPEVLADRFFLDKPCKTQPAYIKQIISSQLDVDRMDYLVRDAHFSGVPLGNIDLHYLIRSLAIVEHGSGHATLGLTTKGVKAYEAFALARHHMNRTVYYHAKVAVLELLLEECLLEISAEIAAGNQNCGGIPVSLLTLLRAQGASTADDFIEANLSAYLDITEDHVWTAVGFVSNSWQGRAQDLSHRLLTRRVPEHFLVQQGKAGDVASVLERAGFSPYDYRVRPKKSKVYSDSADDDVVHVLSEDGNVETVTAHSFTLEAFANKPEVETLLVVLDASKVADIWGAAKRCLVQSRSAEDRFGSLKGLRNTRSTNDSAGDIAQLDEDPIAANNRKSIDTHR
jgi:HD superfamily phosphohydrolase